MSENVVWNTDSCLHLVSLDFGWSIIISRCFPESFWNWNLVCSFLPFLGIFIWMAQSPLTCTCSLACKKHLTWTCWMKDVNHWNTHCVGVWKVGGRAHNLLCDNDNMGQRGGVTGMSGNYQNPAELCGGTGLRHQTLRRTNTNCLMT